MVLKQEIPQFRLQRILLGLLAILLGFVALAGSLSIGFSENTGAWVAGSVGKVAMLMAVAWLAWPQLMWLRQSPSGMTVLVGLAIGGVFFVVRPKLLLYAIPLLMLGIGLLLSLTWIQRILSPPK